MKHKLLLIILILLINSVIVKSQTSGTDVYLLTCDPGQESYTLYGHSALRLVDQESQTDIVYNWGVFDFTTPNFNYKFAKGKLTYLLAAYPYKSFLKEYSGLNRAVFSQQVFMSDEDIFTLKKLLNDNLKPENVSYLYDFFWDNCATRIRDIFENVYGERLIYPEPGEKKHPTYRDRLDEFHQGVLWMDVGMDLLLGSPGDQECAFRESMFLPEYLMTNLAQSYVIEDGVERLLFGETETIFDHQRIEYDNSLLKQPWLWMSIGFLLLLFFSFRVRNRFMQNSFDLLFWLIMSLLAILLVFLNYITEHIAMGQNFNMIWLNPLIPISLYAMFARQTLKWFWRAQIAFAVIFMIVVVIMKQSINPAFIPVILLLITRSYYRLALKH